MYYLENVSTKSKISCFIFSLSIAFVKRNGLDCKASNCLGKATPVTTNAVVAQFLQYVGVFISSFYGFLIFGESLSIATVGAGIAMFISSVMLARLKEQSGPLREGKVIEDKIK